MTQSCYLYCMRHGQMEMADIGLSGWSHQVWVTRHHAHIEVCRGPFVHCPPPELPEDWELYLTEPSFAELVMMNENADELESEMK